MGEQLTDIANAMVAHGKGILAADESSATIEKRFAGIKVESTPQNRRDYRELLFRSEAAMRDYISGVILFDETLRQEAADGTPLIEIIRSAGAVPGIKVDEGAHALAGRPGEKVTHGLDTLRQRLREYYDLGARFAKWRAVIGIGEGLPSRHGVMANVHALARYAALCQEAGIVPIVEPEVQMDGENSMHDIDRCYVVTEQVLKALYSELAEAGVVLEGTVLKPNMVTPGRNCPTRATPREVAEKTLRCLHSGVPRAVPGIAFLSGGQSDVEATEHLNLMNAAGPHPWNLTFSYGRALQAAALAAWGGRADNAGATRAAFSHRARMNGLAATGAWSRQLEQAA